MSESPIPSEADLPVRHGWLRRNLSLLVVLNVLFVALLVGAAWWWSSRPDFGDTVRAAGGRYRFGDMSTPLGRLSDWINDRPTYVYHLIEFAPGNVDDEWLGQHQSQIRNQSTLILSLRETRVTDHGLSHLRGMENLNYLELAGTRLSDAAMSHIVSLPMLASLDIADTGLSGEAVADLGQMPHLAHITMDASQATPEAFSGLAKCPNFSSVMILDANDESVAQVAQLNGLIGVTLIGVDVTPANLPALMQMQGLQVLTFVDTNLSEDEIHELQQSLPGCTVQQFSSEQLEQAQESTWE